MRATLLLQLLLLVMRESAVCRGVLLGGSVLPHGDFAWLPSLLPAGSANRSRAEAVRAGAQAVAARIAAASPDVVLVIAPHAAALSIAYAVYGNSGAAGTAALGGDLHNSSVPLVPLSVAAAGAPALAARLAGALAGSNVTLLTFWGDSEAAPLRWSEVVPLAFLGALVNGSAARTAVAVWSQPASRLACAACLVPQLLALGGALAAQLAAAPERVWLLASADLAHTHPAAVNPYPPNASAAGTFDAAAGEWAAALDADALLRRAGAVVDDALSCGFTGMVLLHAALAAAPGGLRAWTPRLEAPPVAPTYYGMLAAHFEHTGG